MMIRYLARLILAGMTAACLVAAPAGASEVAATVLDEEVRSTDPDEVRDVILTRLFDQYAADHGLAAKDDEISASIDKMKRGLRAEGITGEEDLTPEEAAQVETMRRDMMGSIIRQWRINQRLYGEYGGRVIYQQLGPEPLDAYRRFLEERQRAGAFTIIDKSFEASFWRYFTDDTLHTFFEPGSEGSAFSTPPWERQ